jgi:hypothetical protein
MAGLIGNLIGRDNLAKKLQKEIEGMELKKQALLAAVTAEIQAAGQRKDNELYLIGSAVYKAHAAGVPAEAAISVHFENIAGLEKLMAEKEAKIQEIASRYDEEIGILTAQTELAKHPREPEPAPAFVPVQSGPVCVKCGKAFNPEEDMFCIGCGNKLI